MNQIIKFLEYENISNKTFNLGLEYSNNDVQEFIKKK